MSFTIMEVDSPPSLLHLPRKRLKLHHLPSRTATNNFDFSLEARAAARFEDLTIMSRSGNTAEENVGILHFASPQTAGFKGKIKDRYVFIVINMSTNLTL